MKISCPKCHASGTILDHEIPESGRFVNCPRCKEGFTITRPRSGNDAYLVDTCPACGFSTFGDETFSTCLKCGVSVKTYVERQREEQLVKRTQELLGKRSNNLESTPGTSKALGANIADFIENLHPVNLISWGVAAAAIIILGLGLWGIIGYDGAKIKALLVEQGDEQVSELSIFLHHGLSHWVKLLYGTAAMAVSLMFLKRLKIALRAMSTLLWSTIVLVPLLYIISFVTWVLAPIPHTTSGFAIELFNITFMSALVGAPLYLLERYLHESTITSVVKL